MSNSTIIPLVREVFIFRPPRRTGIIVHSIAVAFLSIIGVFGLWQASLAESGPTFLVFLLVALLAIAFLPTLIYRMYALQRARYTLARDGISIYWGLRREDIPINLVNRVGSAEQNGMVLQKPFLRIPGAVLGVKSQTNGKPVEFLAARDTNLVMITTPDKIFAISPADSSEFLLTYRKLAEYGSLVPIQSVSDYPTFLLSRSWSDLPARLLLITSALLALGLILWVSLSISNHPQISLRLTTNNAPVELVPGIRLLLLPVLNTFFFITDLLLGLFFYRKEDTKILAYLMWASSALTSLLFYGAVYFILQAV
jgi:Bacterial PH domain